MIHQEWGGGRGLPHRVAVMVLAERSRAQVWQVGVGDWLNAGNWSGGLPSYYGGGSYSSTMGRASHYWRGWSQHTGSW